MKNGNSLYGRLDFRNSLEDSKNVVNDKMWHLSAFYCGKMECIIRD